MIDALWEFIERLFKKVADRDRRHAVIDTLIENGRIVVVRIDENGKFIAEIVERA
jgi:hypothetical protein